MTGTHSKRAGKALEELVEVDPAIAALSLWCTHRDGPETATQGSTITYGPEFEALAPHEQRGLAAHHILHVALRHSARLAEMGDRLGDRLDADRWNMAADALVNDALLQADHALPRPAVTAATLLEEAGTTVSPEAALAEWDVERLYHFLTSPDGQGAADRQQFQSDLSPVDGLGELATEEAATEWRQHLARALAAGRRAGRGLGMIGHRIADIPEPRTPWELVLRGLLARAATVLPRPHSTRPARRWLAASALASQQGTPSPGFEPGHKPLTDVPRIAVAFDASGSIDADRLGVFWSEVTGIARRLRAELHLMIFDEEIRHIACIDPGASPDLPPMPRDGGTAFIPVIDAAAALDAVALVILTDLEGDPGPAPRFPVIWAVPDAAGRSAPYGRVLDLSH